MGVFELILLGIALAMDAFAVTISNMFVYRGMTKSSVLLMPIFFGIFQGVMPLIGFFAGSLISDFLNQYKGIVTFLILDLIGGKMIFDAYKELKEKRTGQNLNADQPVKTGTQLTVGILTMQAIATSIDALAVGVSFAASNTNIWLASSIIVLTTFICCLIACMIGKRFGNLLEERASIIGGIVLILIGIKALID